MQQLEAGNELTIGPFRMDASTVEAYLCSTEGDSSFYEDMEAVPPMAVAGRTLGALIESLSMPAGSVHIGQNLQFQDTVKPGQELLCSTKVSRASNRAGWRIIVLDLTVQEKERTVLTGKTTVMLPLEEAPS